MKTKIALLSFFFSLSLYSFSQEKSKFSRQLDAVLETFDQRSTDPLKPFLATGYTINGIPVGYEQAVLEQALPQIPKFSAYTVTKTVKEKAGTRLYVSFKHTGEPFACNFLIDPKGKIRELNILEDAVIQQQ